MYPTDGVKSWNEQHSFSGLPGGLVNIFELDDLLSIKIFLQIG